MKKLFDYWMAGYVVVLESYFSDDEYAKDRGDEFEDLEVQDFSDEACASYEVRDDKKAVYIKLLDDDEYDY